MHRTIDIHGRAGSAVEMTIGSPPRPTGPSSSQATKRVRRPETASSDRSAGHARHRHPPGSSSTMRACLASGGGYVGIEVFFVISGFVITGLLLRDTRGRAHVASQLLRAPGPSHHAGRDVGARRERDRRLCLLGPLSGNQTGNDGRWASVFLINIHFESNGTNYLCRSAAAFPH